MTNPLPPPAFFVGVLIVAGCAIFGGAWGIGRLSHKANIAEATAQPKPPFAINVKLQSLYGHDYLVFVATSGEEVEGTSVIHSESCTNNLHLR